MRADETAASGGAPAPSFTWPLRVYHEDTDGSGAVYHAGYLRFIERARTEWLRALGFEQPELAARHGVMFVVRSLSIEYLAPARFNDDPLATVGLRAWRGSRIALVQEVRRGPRALAQAAVDIACVNTASFRPVRIPAVVARALDRCGFAGELDKEPL